MARILCISSQVVRGHVGNCAAVFALQRLGHEAWALPTVILSNHPGHALVAGERVGVAALAKLIDALDRNGWLGEIDAILSGYLPSAEHVALVAETVERLRQVEPGLPYFCDPVLGDDPKGLYIDKAAAEAIGDQLLGLATVIFPNRFELAFLSGREVKDVATAVAAARALGRPQLGVVATSIPGEKGELVTLIDDIPPRQTKRVASLCRVAKRPSAPHGTGDLLAALFTGHSMRGAPSPLGLAVAGVEAAIAASDGADELRLVRSQQAWGEPEPLAVEAFDDGDVT